VQFYPEGTWDSAQVAQGYWRRKLVMPAGVTYHPFRHLPEKSLAHPSGVFVLSRLVCGRDGGRM
jgi:hypothetical protein